MHKVQVSLNIKAFKSGEGVLILELPSPFSRAWPEITQRIRDEGVNKSFMFYLNGEFKTPSTIDTLQEGDQILILPLMGGG
jgi:ThiS family